MKKALFAALVAVFVLGFVATAYAVPPVVSGADGTSVFTYQDLQDASAKTEGGYAAYDGGAATGTYWNGAAIVPITPSGNGDVYANPHGGYSSATNKCKVCHAVHRAEGAYYLLRGDSQADACSYCHIGGSAHSNKVVYDLNPAGIYTNNGHTMGASSAVPDSSMSQTATVVTINGVDADMNPVSEDIAVRSYDPAKIELYRFSRHHSQAAVGTGRGGWKPVGPNSLSCFSCHQPHNAVAQVWRPSDFDVAVTADGAFRATGYKLLRRFPSGGWLGLDGLRNGTLNSYGMVDSNRAIKVPESTLTAGVNYSTDFSSKATYTENGYTGRQPTWVVQGWDVGAGTGPSEDPATVNNMTLSVWCADCHNLNIGGAIELTQEELGFKAHTERTHPAPFVGAHSGPGQCYSCHRDDLSVMNNTADPAGYGMQQAAVNQGANQSCTQCHYSTLAYYTDRTQRNSDFPHSGRTTDIKLLGSYTAAVAGSGSYTPVFSSATIGESNLDAVCIRCHPGIGIHN